MKRTYLMLIITMLVIGFASVATNLVINGTINFGFNSNDFDSNILFTYAKANNGEANINDNNKAITFNTIKLEDVNEKAILKYDIANKSSQYDASVTINCIFEKDSEPYQEYLDIDNSLKNDFKLKSGETITGYLTITLTKAYNESLTQDVNMLCTIVATPGERVTEGTYTPVEHQYEEILLKGADPVLDAAQVNTFSLVSSTSNKKLIPVTIDNNGIVKRADTTKEWYNYEKKEWANAVILIDGVEEPSIDQPILDSQIESYFVWIPKYRYKIFDMGKYNDANKALDDSKQNKAIEIEFGLENTTNNASEMECETPNKSGEDGQCQKDYWMTHPAFTAFPEIHGFWVGKFETGYKNADENTMTEAYHCINVENINKEETSIIIIKPNSYSWRCISIGNAYKNSYAYQRNLDSHMMKNTEWGAVTYLTQSVYGRCDDTKCTEVGQNKSSSYITGTMDATIAYPKSQDASTTGNNTGIFDMSSGAWEEMASVMQESNNETFLWSQSELDAIENEKYIDIYNYGTETEYSRRILGDATGEMGPFNNSIGSYFGDAAQFISLSGPWFYRGGYYVDTTNGGIFDFARNNGQFYPNVGFRIILSPQ